jgi:hypothetical protein
LSDGTTARERGRRSLGGGRFVVGVLQGEEPDYVGAFVGGGIAGEEVAHCLVEMSFTVFCGCQQCRRLALGSAGRGEEWR